jgi:hypothetical protein
MSSYPELSDQWEVVTRHGNYGWGNIILEFLAGLLLGGVGGVAEPRSITWTVRHKSTGEARTVTAKTAEEVIAKINNGQFDTPPSGNRSGRHTLDKFPENKA